MRFFSDVSGHMRWLTPICVFAPDVSGQKRCLTLLCAFAADARSTNHHAWLLSRVKNPYFLFHCIRAYIIAHAICVINLRNADHKYNPTHHFSSTDSQNAVFLCVWCCLCVTFPLEVFDTKLKLTLTYSEVNILQNYLLFLPSVVYWRLFPGLVSWY